MPKLSNSISCYGDFLSFLNFYINQCGLERIEVFLIIKFKEFRFND